VLGLCLTKCYKSCGDGGPANRLQGTIRFLSSTFETRVFHAFECSLQTIASSPTQKLEGARRTLFR
jgi:hypothetical protein